MYSGTTLRAHSGNFLGAHQKIDRVACRHFEAIKPAAIVFPSTKDILHFEGRNGPDGIKAKSPSRDEPWHYIDPTDPTDTALAEMIADHSRNLTDALAGDNHERAAFEAAWLAHAIVDGLTPAHHYPLDDKIEELWGHPKELRLTIRQKNIIIGKSHRDTISKNWQYWGAKGVFTTHFMFEFGFATTIAPIKLDNAKPSSNQLVRVEREGIKTLFMEAVYRVHELNMYEEFYRKGWTRHLGRLSRQELAPIIIQTVVMAWYEAAVIATRRKERKQ